MLATDPGGPVTAHPRHANSAVRGVTLFARVLGKPADLLLCSMAAEVTDRPPLVLHRLRIPMADLYKVLGTHAAASCREGLWYPAGRGQGGCQETTDGA